MVHRPGLRRQVMDGFNPSLHGFAAVLKIVDIPQDQRQVAEFFRHGPAREQHHLMPGIDQLSDDERPQRSAGPGD